MASLYILLLFSSFIIFHVHRFQAHVSCLSTSLVLLPLTKDFETLQYVTRVHQGEPLAPIKLVLDLGGPFLWADCGSSGRVSPSSNPNPIPSCSLQCSRARGSEICFSPGEKGPLACDVSTANGITGFEARGELLEGVLGVGSLYGSDSYGPILKVENFLFSCAPAFLLSGLASGSNGMLGLGRTQIGLPSQIANTIGSQRKFCICLSSSNGVVTLGDAPVDTIFGAKFSGSLVYTPLVNDPSGSEEYFIDVKSIKINNRRLSLNLKRIGATKMSTTVPYTTMESSIYSTFIEAYELAATSMNMTRVAPISPFGLCFSSRGVSATQTGPLVPAIDLVLQSEMVKWRVTGRNSMVPVSDEVMCLGFLDGGSNSKASIVIGGFQLEDNLLEFNLGTNMLGFGSSLLMRQLSCSDFISESHVLNEAE